MMEMAVAMWLRASGFTDVLVRTASALLVPEPVVVLGQGYERDARTRGCERGRFCVRVLVVRESPADAGEAALHAEACVRKAAWKDTDATDGWRLRGVDTTVPAFRGYDGSGRAVWGFAVTMTCERDDDEQE